MTTKLVGSDHDDNAHDSHCESVASDMIDGGLCTPNCVRPSPLGYSLLLDCMSFSTCMQHIQSHYEQSVMSVIIPCCVALAYMQTLHRCANVRQHRGKN
eukprot:10456-Heterococcus_DN1.PRE.1